jgi:hypothetical protein
MIEQKFKPAFIATIAFLLFACGSKTDVDFSIVPKLETYPLAVCAARHQQIVQPTTMEEHYENKTL